MTPRLDCPAPDEDAAEARAWETARAAFRSREPVSRPVRHGRIAVVAAVGAVAVAVIAAAATPAGRSTVERIRGAVGLERSEPALFRLPSPGRLLVVSAEGGGIWVVRHDGSKRRIGDYDDATWSPRGLFIATTTRNELRTVEPDGDVRWTLPRRDVSAATWSPSGFRIAYSAGAGIRVVAGDGTGDRLLTPFGGPAAWHPRLTHVLTTYEGGALVQRDVDSGTVLWHRDVQGARRVPVQLTWSSDGAYLAAVFPHELRVLDARGRLTRRLRLPRVSLLQASWRPGRHAVALHLRSESGRSRHSEVRLLTTPRARPAVLFPAVGALGGLAWSPDGRWLLVQWPDADQWVFVRPETPGRLRAVSNIAAQFPRPDGRPPLLVGADRWCCRP